MNSASTSSCPKFFRLRQQFPRPQIGEIPTKVVAELSKVFRSQDLDGKRIAVTVGSRGIANIADIIKGCVGFLQQLGAEPCVVAAMGSHGGATAKGQLEVLHSLGVTEKYVGCPVLSDMAVVEVCHSPQGYPVFVDKHAYEADGILVVNRIKSHTRFAGSLESGLMKMMLIGLGKQTGAEIYHRLIHNYSFDEIVRSVAPEVIQKCNVLAGLAILENAYEETADLVSVPAREIEQSEPELLQKVKGWMPRLPFDKAELLIVDQIGKNISGTGMDTNVIGRKKNDHAAIEGEKPDLHHIYVRSLTRSTHGNASGIGLAELCHERVLRFMDDEKTRMNCVTAGHVIGAMKPMGFASDREAIQTACKLAGYIEPSQVTGMWIKDTLRLDEVECSEALLPAAREAKYEILREPRELDFDAHGNLIERFALDEDCLR